MSVKSKMTALADEIRELSGTTGVMGLDAMTSTLNTENNNFATNLSTQDDLLAQIQTALEGKAAGGFIEPSGTYYITSNGTYEVSSYKMVEVNIQNGTDVPILPDSSSSLPTVATGFVQSTAEGSVIYTIVDSEGDLDTDKYSLQYFAQTKKYRYALDTALVANTPIVVLTSGTITMPMAQGYTCETIASGTGYAIYRYVVSYSSPEEGEIPF